MFVILLFFLQVIGVVADAFSESTIPTSNISKISVSNQTSRKQWHTRHAHSPVNGDQPQVTMMKRAPPNMPFRRLPTVAHINNQFGWPVIVSSRTQFTRTVTTTTVLTSISLITIRTSTIRSISTVVRIVTTSSAGLTKTSTTSPSISSNTLPLRTTTTTRTATIIRTSRSTVFVLMSSTLSSTSSTLLQTSSVTSALASNLSFTFTSSLSSSNQPSSLSQTSTSNSRTLSTQISMSAFSTRSATTLSSSNIKPSSSLSSISTTQSISTSIFRSSSIISITSSSSTRPSSSLSSGTSTRSSSFFSSSPVVSTNPSSSFQHNTQATLPSVSSGVNQTTTLSSASNSSASTASTAPTAALEDDGPLPIVPGAITYEQFKKAVSFYNLTSAGGFPPEPSLQVYRGYLLHAAPIMNITEQAMLISNLIWESGGFQYREELACAGTLNVTRNCPYGKYYGRGYIQLSWDYNYKAASMDIYGDDRLLLNPDLALGIDASWEIAVWFWLSNVRPRLIENDAIERLALGYSVRAINGVMECVALGNTLKNHRFPPKVNMQAALNRLAIFKAICVAWGISSKPVIEKYAFEEDKDAQDFDKLYHLLEVADLEFVLYEPSLLGCL